MSRYLAAVQWIALNDEPGSDDSLNVKEVSSMITVLLVADVFGFKPERVAQDVVTYRYQTEERK